MSGRVFTWHYRAALKEDVSKDLVLVRTSVGAPRGIKRAVLDELASIEELTPFGLFGAGLTDEQFEAGYVARLEEFGVERIEARFRELIEANDGLSLALLCFEREPEACHRGIFARWWLEQTGEVVAEWTGKPAAAAEAV